MGLHSKINLNAMTLGFFPEMEDSSTSIVLLEKQTENILLVCFFLKTG